MTMEDMVSDLTDTEVFTLTEAIAYKEIDDETMPSAKKLNE